MKIDVGMFVKSAWESYAIIFSIDKIEKSAFLVIVDWLLLCYHFSVIIASMIYIYKYMLLFFFSLSALSLAVGTGIGTRQCIFSSWVAFMSLVVQFYTLHCALKFFFVDLAKQLSWAAFSFSYWFMSRVEKWTKKKC